MSNDSRKLSYTHQDIQPPSKLTNLNDKEREKYKSIISYGNTYFDKLINYSERNGIDIDVIIKNKGVIETKSIKVIIERISLNQYYIFIEMMNETFKYCSEINEKNYLNIKKENNLLVEFHDFIDYFLELIKNCKNYKKNNLSCILEDFDNNNGGCELVRFIVEEKTKYKTSNHLVLRMKKVNPLFNGAFSNKSLLLEDYKEKYNNLLKNYNELKSKYIFLQNNKNQNSNSYEEEKSKLINYYENKLAQQKDILNAKIQLDSNNFILENKKIELESKIQILTNELNNIRTENEDLYKQINDLNQKNRNLSSNYDDLKSENESRLRKINEKNENLEKLNKKIENLNLELEKKDDKIKNLEIKNSKLNNLINCAKAELNSAINIKQKCESDLKNSNSNIDKLFKYLKEKDSLISEKEDSINNYKSIINKKNFEYESKVDENNKLKKEIELYKQKIEEKDKCIKESQKKISYLKNLRDKIGNNIGENPGISHRNYYKQMTTNNKYNKYEK